MSGIDTDKVSRWWQLVTLQKIISIYIFFFVFSFFEREKTFDVDSIWLHPCAYPCVFAADYSKWCVSLVPLRDTSVLCALPGSGSLPLPTAQRWPQLQCFVQQHCVLGGRCSVESVLITVIGVVLSCLESSCISSLVLLQTWVKTRSSFPGLLGAFNRAFHFILIG